MTGPPAAAPRARAPAGLMAAKTYRRSASLRARRAANGPALNRPETLATLATLAAQNTLHATAIEQIPLGLCMFDAQNRLVVANRRQLQIWGLPEPLGQPGTTFAEIMAATRGTDVLLDSADHGPPVHRPTGPNRAGGAASGRSTTAAWWPPCHPPAGWGLCGAAQGQHRQAPVREPQRAPGATMGSPAWPTGSGWPS